jgi:glutaredoxin
MVQCALLLSLVASCDGEGSASVGGEPSSSPDLQGELVTPPFAVRGEAEGLLLVWFDDDGVHTADRRSAVPEAHREHVRVDSLRIAPEARLDPDYVYVADLREEVEGTYRVRKLPRSAFDTLVDRASGTPAVGPAVAAPGDADVIIYGADWCNACRSAARFFRDRNVPFVEKNIERDQAAYAEMQQKAREAGVRTGGIPIIDFRGTLLSGFDQRRLAELIRQSGS